MATIGDPGFPDNVPFEPATVVCCYARADYKHLSMLRKQLSALRRQGLIAVWYDHMIEPGMPWRDEIDRHLDSAQIVLLLISAEFLDSDFCYDVEMRRAMELHEAGTARVIPIIVRPCDWRATPFARLQALPPGARPATRWKTLDDAFYAVAESIRKIVEPRESSSVRLAGRTAGC